VVGGVPAFDDGDDDEVCQPHRPGRL